MIAAAVRQKRVGRNRGLGALMGIGRSMGVGDRCERDGERWAGQASARADRQSAAVMDRETPSGSVQIECRRRARHTSPPGADGRGSGRRVGGAPS
jgi:hypothetical protein